MNEFSYTGKRGGSINETSSMTILTSMTFDYSMNRRVWLLTICEYFQWDETKLMTAIEVPRLCSLQKIHTPGEPVPQHPPRWEFLSCSLCLKVLKISMIPNGTQDSLSLFISWIYLIIFPHTWVLTSGEIQPKNRHCLRGLDGKYGRWDEILRDILIGKLKIVQNRKKSEGETEDEDDIDEDEEMPEATGNITYDTSKRNGRYAPIQTNPEEDAIQIHTDGEIPGENLEHDIRRSNRKTKKLKR